MNASLSHPQTSPLPAKVMIAIDGSAASQHAAVYARHFVAPGGTIRLVGVAENPRALVPMGSLVGATLEAAREELSRDAEQALANARNIFAGSDLQVETEEIDLSKHGGDIVHALLEAAGKWGADLVVAGAHQQHGLLRWIEGTVSEPLARLSRCPTLIVPGSYSVKADRLPERIAFAVDGSPHATQALEYGKRFATHETSLLALYVIDRAVRLSDLVPIDVLEDAFIEEGTKALVAAKALLTETSTRLSTRLTKTAHVNDDIAHTIVREAADWSAELIVMGTHGRRGVARWMLGSVAERVVRLAQTPVLLVHADQAKR